MLDFLKRKGKERDIRKAMDTVHSLRAFQAAEISRLISTWKWDGGFSNQEISASLAALRSHSREMVKNNGDFKKYIAMVIANVVGNDGFALKSTAIKSVSDPALDSEAAFAVEYHFARWCENKDWADSTGRKNFAGICRLAASNWARDGEAFIRVDFHAQNPYGISLRVIRADACPEWYQGTTTSGNCIRNGVEVDKYTLRPVAYYFCSREEDRTLPVIHAGTAHHLIRIPATEILHLFTQHDECQTRGIPLTHAALFPGKLLEEFNIAELAAAKDEANWLGVFKAPAGRDDEIVNLADDEEEANKLRRVSRTAHDVILQPGWDYDPKVPNHPNREVAAFKASIKRDLANALNVEYANFANDWAGVTFSSVRAGTLAERDNWMVMQDEFICAICSPLYKMWLNSWLRLAASGSYGIADFDRLCSHSFHGRRWQWVDPLKDANAQVIAVKRGWKTDAQVAADYGFDLDDNLEDMKRIKALRESYGLADPDEKETQGEENANTQEE